jgi:hypothetical protein
MELKKRYSNINDTLRHLRLQVEESLNFAQNYVPSFSSPVELFLWLKPQLKYKNDPKGVELLQSMPTLIKNNFYGVSGMGDCDCFTIAMLASCMVQNWRGKNFIILAGRNKFTPVHIWSGVDLNNNNYNLDLTNAIPNKVRDYPYTQKLYVKDIN